MPKFEYKVISPSGKEVIGEVEEDSANTVANLLRERGGQIVYVRELKGASATINILGNIQIFQQKITTKDLSIFTNHFGTMLSAGLTISRSLSVLERQTENKRLVEIIKQVEKEVRDGNQLSAALRKFPDIFTPLYISMVQAGEESGSLGQALLTMSKFLQKDLSTRNKLKSAMTYPAIVLIASIGIVLALFIFVIPTFKGFLDQLGANLPKITLMIFAFSNFLLHYGWVFLILVVVGYAFYIFWSRTPRGRETVDSIKLHLPIISGITLKSAASRFASTFAVLFSTGVPMIRCLETVKGVIDNVVISDKIEQVVNSVRQGLTLSVALEKTGIFTPMVYDMVAVGEESGSLDMMLTKVSEFYDEEVDGLVDNLASMINPILMVFVGGIIGIILIGLYLPVFQMASYIK